MKGALQITYSSNVKKNFPKPEALIFAFSNGVFLYREERRPSWPFFSMCPLESGHSYAEIISAGQSMMLTMSRLQPGSPHWPFSDKLHSIILAGPFQFRVFCHSIFLSWLVLSAVNSLKRIWRSLHSVKVLYYIEASLYCSDSIKLFKLV